MSVAAITWAWNQDVSRNLLPELLALADNANDLGICWVKVATVAAKTKTTERTVQRNLHRLSDAGFLEIIERRMKGSGNRCNLYLLPLPTADRAARAAFIDEMTTGTQAVKRARGEGDTSVTQGGVTPASPRGDTSVTHNRKKEPTLKGSSPTDAARKPTRAPKGPHRLPDDWAVTDKIRTTLHGQGFTDPQIDSEAVKFTIYWQERDDEKAKKASWGMTFLNWMKRAGEKIKPEPEGTGFKGYKPNRGNYGRPQSRNATGAGLLGQYADQYAQDSRGESSEEFIIDGEYTRT